MGLPSCSSRSCCTPSLRVTGRTGTRCCGNGPPTHVTRRTASRSHPRRRRPTRRGDVRAHRRHRHRSTPGPSSKHRLGDEPAPRRSPPQRVLETNPKETHTRHPSGSRRIPRPASRARTRALTPGQQGPGTVVSTSTPPRACRLRGADREGASDAAGHRPHRASTAGDPLVARADAAGVRRTGRAVGVPPVPHRAG